MLCQTKSFARMELVCVFKLGLSCQFDKQHLIDEAINPLALSQCTKLAFF